MGNYNRPSKKFSGSNRHHDGFGQSGQWRQPKYSSYNRPKPQFHRPKQSRSLIDEILFPRSSGKKKRR